MTITARPRQAALAAVAMMAFAAGTTANAQTTTPPGRLLASQCFQCHGTNGNPTAGWERLAGKSAGSIYEELVEMRGKADNEHGLMRVHAMGYTDNQLNLIAQYFASQSRTGSSGSSTKKED